MEASKQKILKAVKKTRVDLELFKRLTTFGIPGFKMLSSNLEAYEKGGISTSGFRSDQLQQYLFEHISAT